MNRNVLITGASGQDGRNMIDYLLRETNYNIYGAFRSSTNMNIETVPTLRPQGRFTIVEIEMTDQQSVINCIKRIKPDFLINFAGQSFVGASWNNPINYLEVNAMGVLYLLEAIKEYCPKCRLYSAGSSEEFGNVEYSPQDLKHPIKPRSPYGVSKATARHLIKVYRESYNLYCIHSILFNHEGTKRGKNFVTRKITSNLARIKKEIEFNPQNNYSNVIPFELGNLEVSRDWSDSEDFMEAIWLMLQQPVPMDYLLSSNETHTIKEFLLLAISYAGFNEDGMLWDYNNRDATELYLIYGDKKILIMKTNPKFYRPAEVFKLCGNSNETRELLNWCPKTSFKELVKKMMLYDIKFL